MTSKARITSMASYLPERILTNSELETMVETSNEWIVSRVGISERRIARSDEAASDMGAEAAKKLLGTSNISSESIDLILVATMTPDYLAPSTAALIQAKIGALNAAAVDFQAACTGFIYGLSLAKAYIESGMYKRILLIASEKMSAFVDYEDRNTCILFGDGAAAALIEGEGSGLVLESICLGADGSNPEIAWIPAGGSASPASQETLKNKGHFFSMQGKELFKQAVRKMRLSAEICMEKAEVREEDLRWIVPHQANARIIDALAKSFTVDPSQIYRTIHKYGNTSASSIAIALDELIREKEIKQGESILLCGFGAGLTWGAAVVKKV